MPQALQTSPTKDGNSVVTTIHRCFPLSVHNIYSEVAMVTIQEVLLAVISGIETSKQHPKSVYLQDV